MQHLVHTAHQRQTLATAEHLGWLDASEGATPSPRRHAPTVPGHRAASRRYFTGYNDFLSLQAHFLGGVK